MNYTISEVAKKTNLSIYTIRYYDKEGLLPFVERVNGSRVFHDHDVEWIEFICCLKNTGMPIKDIRAFIDYYMNNGDDVDKGLQILLRHKQNVEQQVKDTQRNLQTIEHKISYLPQMYKKRYLVGGRS